MMHVLWTGWEQVYRMILGVLGEAHNAKSARMTFTTE